MTYFNYKFKFKGSITLAFWMCSLDVRFTVACVFNVNVIFSVENSKMTLKTHATVKRTSMLHVQNAMYKNNYLACLLSWFSTRVVRISSSS
jgi:hypothetical protein